MKRIFAGILLSFFVIGWFWAGKTAPAPQKAVAPVSASVPPPMPPPPVRASSLSKEARILLQKGKGALLFSALFDQKILENRPSFTELEPLLSGRFRHPYPLDEVEYQRELVSRMGILKALAESYAETSSVAERDSLMNFYRTLAMRNAEHSLVRRQALKNLSAWVKFLPEKKRNEIVSRMPASLLANASLSESELLEDIFHAR